DVSSDAKDKLEVIERFYQQFSFNALLPSEIRATHDESVKTASADIQLAVVPALRNKLEKSLLSMADSLLSCSPDVSRGRCVLACLTLSWQSSANCMWYVANSDDLETRISQTGSRFSEMFVFPQLNNVPKRISVAVDDEQMDDECETTKNPQASNDIDLFEDGEEAHSSTNGSHRQKEDNADASCGPEDYQGKQDLALLAVLEFLCECGSAQLLHGLLFKPQEVRRRLLLLLKQIDFSKALHLNMADPVCNWAILSLRGAEAQHCPVSSVLPSHLADANHQVRMLMLCSVSKVQSYRSVKTFITSHLYYLVAEWLAQRQSDDRYTLGSFPYSLLDHNTVKDFYSSYYQMLIPHLVFLDDFEQVKSIGRCLERDWRHLLADCFPKMMVNILPYFALKGQDSQVAQQREKAHRVYDLLTDASCLGKKISIQKILLAVCEKAAEATNSYERHRILLMYHLFVSLLLREVKDGLGGALDFVLRDIIYTLIHHVNSSFMYPLNHRPLQCDEVSNRSLSLCCDLLTSVCQAALQFCDDALDCHLQVIVGTLTAQVTSQPFISQQEVTHFLSASSCDSLPLTRLEGLKELTRQLHRNKDQIRELLKECHEAKRKLESQEFWMPQAGGHKAWLKVLCTALLDSGGVRSEALLLSRPLCLVSSSSLNSCGTVCDSNFWLELNYLEVARTAQSCSAHFTALLYTEIYVDKIRANMEENFRTKSRATCKINFEENTQNFTISSLTEKSKEDTNISLQELLIEVYRSIGEPDSLYGCGGETMTSPLTRAAEVEELCRGTLEAVSSLYPALRNLQSIRELESSKHLFVSQWRQHSQLLADSDFTVVEPILALRSVAQHTLLSKMEDPENNRYLSSVLTDHLMELCRLARKAGNTQVLAERAVYQMKQHSDGGSWVSSPVLSWQLEEAQVFWVKGEQGLALGLLRQMIHSLEEKVKHKLTKMYYNKSL
ncbi:hypothetical protein GOODEAATRI_001659, partial [Goodea atripinnis]